MSSNSIQTLQVSEILIDQDRSRNDLGSLTNLAASIADVGLLQPIVVRPDHRLVSGARRLGAVQELGWKEIPVHVVENLEDELRLRKAERDENTCRKSLTLAEAVREKQRIEGQAKEEAKQRQREGQKAGGKTSGRGRKKDGGKLPQSNGDGGKSRDKIAEAIGVGERTLAKAEEVIDAAKANPEAFGELAEALDKDDAKADKIHKQFKRRQALQETGLAEADITIAELPEEYIRDVVQKMLQYLSGLNQRWPMPSRVRRMSKSGLPLALASVASLRRQISELHNQISIEQARRKRRKS